MNVVKARHAGFCYGVIQAITKTEEALAEGKPTFFGNATVHNEDVMKRLQSKGFTLYDNVPRAGAKYIVSAHGASLREFQMIEEQGYEIVDTTCKFVRKLQSQFVSDYLKGYQVIIFGDDHHPEIRGIVGQAEGQGEGHPHGEIVVFGTVAEAWGITVKPGAVLYCQTTFSRYEFDEVISILRGKDQLLAVRDSICHTVQARVQAAIDLAKQVEIMVVIGSMTSSNSKRLAQAISETTGKKVIFIESVDSFREDDFREYHDAKIGVTAGASSPPETINVIVDLLRAIR